MTGFMDKVYLVSPIWLQQVMVAVYGWQWYKQRFGGAYSQLVADFETRDHWSATQFAGYQRGQLVRLIESAWRSSYYRKIFDKAGLQPGMDPVDALSKLPYLTKETLRTQSRDLLTQAPPRNTMVFKSSGTTGTPTEIYYTPEFHQLELAVPAVRNFGWAGVDYRVRRVMFGVRKVCRFEQSRPPFWRFSPAEDMAYASIYHLSPDYLPHYLDFLRRFRPSIIMGYPSALRTIAQFALQRHDFPAPAQAVFTTSEMVTDQDRALIEQVWQCRIYDRYGAVENCMFASQCEYGRYHVSPDVGIIEILDRHGNPSPAGEMGEVVCTGLHNRLQPLIRYQIGDVARWAVNQNCPCGRQMPILEAVDGRSEDMCYTSDGRAMLRFDTVFKGVKNIREAQVIQEALGFFVIKVVAESGFGPAEIKRLEQNMMLHVGPVKVAIEIVTAIPRTLSGKFRAVISTLSNVNTQ